LARFFGNHAVDSNAGKADLILCGWLRAAGAEASSGVDQRFTCD